MFWIMRLPPSPPPPALAGSRALLRRLAAHDALEEAVGDAVGIGARGEAALDLAVEPEDAVGLGDHPLLQDRLDPEAQMRAPPRLELAALGEPVEVAVGGLGDLGDPLALGGDGLDD